MRHVLEGLIRQRSSIDDGSVLAMLLSARDAEGSGALSERELRNELALIEMTCVLTRLVQRVTLRLAAGTRIEAQANVGLRPRHPLRIVPMWR